MQILCGFLSRPLAREVLKMGSDGTRRLADPDRLVAFRKLALQRGDDRGAVGRIWTVLSTRYFQRDGCPRKPAIDLA